MLSGGSVKWLTWSRHRIPPDIPYMDATELPNIEAAMRYHGATVESVGELIAWLRALRTKLVREGIHDPPGYVAPKLRRARLEASAEGCRTCTRTSAARYPEAFFPRPGGCRAIVRASPGRSRMVIRSVAATRSGAPVKPGSRGGASDLGRSAHELRGLSTLAGNRPGDHPRDTTARRSRARRF